MLALAQGESEIRGDDVMNALAGEEAKLPTANVAAAARRRRDGMVADGSTVLAGTATQSTGCQRRFSFPLSFWKSPRFYGVTIRVGKGISRDPGRGICMAQTASRWHRVCAGGFFIKNNDVSIRSISFLL